MYASLFVCHIFFTGHCAALSDRLGPYATMAQCRSRVVEMIEASLASGYRPVQEFCGPKVESDLKMLYWKGLAVQKGV